MPELPEVETALRGIAPYLTGGLITSLVVRERRLRWPISLETDAMVPGQRIRLLRRRGKYLLLELERGVLLIHLGMSGSLRVLPVGTPATTHDHVDLVMDSGRLLRLRDPRRFGMLQWAPDPVEAHPLLRSLGPEPLSPAFDGAHLHRLAVGRACAVKSFIMDSHVVVGVGNIYASESLWRAGIHPNRAAGRIAVERYRRLAKAITEVLGAAIVEGGTSLRDFVQEDGNPGYFARHLRVYGLTGQPCPGCGAPIRQRRIGQRSSFYCVRCQH